MFLHCESILPKQADTGVVIKGYLSVLITTKHRTLSHVYHVYSCEIRKSLKPDGNTCVDTWERVCNESDGASSGNITFLHYTGIILSHSAWLPM